MKLTKSDIESVELGQTKVFDLTPLEMFSARTYIYQLSMVTGYKYATKYNRNTYKLSITRTN